MPRTQAERLVAVETKVEIIDGKVDGLHDKLDHFIECADEKYAEKVRVNRIEKNVDSMRITIAKWGGAIIVIGTLAQIFINHFLG